MGYPSETVLVVSIFAVNVVVTSMAAIFRVTYRAFERMEYEGLTSVAYRVVSFTLAMTMLLTGFGVVQVALSFLTGGVVELLLSVIICRLKFVHPGLQFDRVFLKESLRIAIPFTLSNVFTMIYIRIDGDAVRFQGRCGSRLVQRCLQPCPGP